MKATFLSKQIIDDNNLKEFIVNNVYDNDFFENINNLIQIHIPLQDFDGEDILALSRYRRDYEPWEGLFKSMKSSGYPILSYPSVRDDCNIIQEDDEKIIVEYGTYPTKKSLSYQDIEALKRKHIIGDLEETDEPVCIMVDSDGTKEMAKKYRDNKTGVEYVFMSKKGDKYSYSIEDYPEAFPEKIEANVGVIEPIKWVVDKKSGIMIPKEALFMVGFYGDYRTSKLREYLESGEFFQDIGVMETIKQEENKVTMPWKEKQDNIPLKERINKILMGRHRIPYLVGHPGVGKTAIAKSINPHCLAYNISTFTPDRFTGKTALIPGKTKIVTNEDGTTYSEGIGAGTTSIALPDWYEELIKMSKMCEEKGERCLLFFDEFDKITPNMQVFINGVVDTPRTIANLEIPDNVDIIFAGNTEEYSDAAFPITGEVESRLTRIEVEPNYINWLSWASKNDIDPLVKAYLFINKDDIIKDVMTKDGKYDHCKSLTPRSWDQKISEEIKISRKIGDYPTLENYMDDQARIKFEEFMKRYFELGIEQILDGKFEEIEDVNFDLIETQTIINCLIATATTEEQLENVFIFLNRVKNPEYRSLFEKLWLKINDTDEDILKLRTAELEAQTKSEVSYGR